MKWRRVAVSEELAKRECVAAAYMWFSVFAGSNEPRGRESGSGNADVEDGSSLKDSTGWEACSDWSDWNLLEKKTKKKEAEQVG